LTVVAAALIACNLAGAIQRQPTAVSAPPPAAASTQSEAGTLATLSTALAAMTPAASETLAPTSTPTETPQGSATYSLTRAPYGTPGVNLDVPLEQLCNAAFFVGYVGSGDGAPVGVAETFKKVWDVRNIGTCTWTREYRLVFFGGEHMSGPNRVAFPKDVPPGDHMFIGVIMIAPYEGGTHTSYWMLQAADGSKFGVGEKGDRPLRGSIFVP
jgi:hypothetical protein